MPSSNAFFSGTPWWQAIAISVEVVQALARTLVAEVVPQDQQPDANNYFTVNGGIGTILGFGIGSLNLVALHPMLYFDSNYQVVFLCGAVFLIITSITTLALTDEPPAAPDEEDNRGGGAWAWVGVGVRDIRQSFETVPQPVSRAVVAQFLHMCGWVPYIYFISDWFGVYLYGGSSDEDSSAYAVYQLGRSGRLGRLARYTSLTLLGGGVCRCPEGQPW
jgi:solute carrier family 45, member 1/2/4